jgi:hypothetical protein
MMRTTILFVSLLGIAPVMGQEALSVWRDPVEEFSCEIEAGQGRTRCQAV